MHLYNCLVQCKVRPTCSNVVKLCFITHYMNGKLTDEVLAGLTIRYRAIRITSPTTADKINDMLIEAQTKNCKV